MLPIGPGSTLFGRFGVVRALGKGGMATVWLAFDGESQREVALKLLHARFREKNNIVERLEREGAVLTALSHPGIAASLGFFQDEEHVALVMEYVEGVTLERWLGERNLERRPLSMEEVSSIFGQLLDAVEHAHEGGVLHRDLKPQNILIARDSLRTKILDFGIAKLLEADFHEATTQGRRVGSPYYMAPEQARGDPVDARADIFSLGSILYELLTLRRAWLLNIRGERLAAFVDDVPDAQANAAVEIASRIANGERPRPSFYRPELPPFIDETVVRALAVRIEDRFASIASFRAALAPPPQRKLSPWMLAPLALVPLAILALRDPPPTRAAPQPISAKPQPFAKQRPPVEPELELEPEPEAEPDLLPHRRPQRPPRPPTPAAIEMQDPLDQLLADVRSKPSPTTMNALAQEIERRAAALPDETKRRRIRRIAESSALTGDADGLESALEELRREAKK